MAAAVGCKEQETQAQLVTGLVSSIKYAGERRAQHAHADITSQPARTPLAHTHAENKVLLCDFQFWLKEFFGKGSLYLEMNFFFIWTTHAKLRMRLQVVASTVRAVARRRTSQHGQGANASMKWARLILRHSPPNSPRLEVQPRALARPSPPPPSPPSPWPQLRFLRNAYAKGRRLRLLSRSCDHAHWTSKL